MGNRFELCVVSENEKIASQFLDLAVEEIKRIEALLSTFRSDSQTNLINENAGIRPVEVALEVFELIERSIKISHLTQGAFDLTYGGLDKSLWNFDTTMKSLPSAEKAKESVSLIDFRNIVLEHESKTVFLSKKGMRIGFGGIGKGYAADKAKLLLQKKGVHAGYINASGDLVTWGRQSSGKGWNIGLNVPGKASEYLGQLEINDAAIATSGDYEKFAIIDGISYSHTIDPKTGYPVRGIKSVSVITANAELADAMATPITVMGVEKGLNLVNQLNRMECIIIDENNRLYVSNGLKVK